MLSSKDYLESMRQEDPELRYGQSQLVLSYCSSLVLFNLVYRLAVVVYSTPTLTNNVYSLQIAFEIAARRL